jgi:putative ABC transport system permease protein
MAPEHDGIRLGDQLVEAVHGLRSNPLRTALMLTSIVISTAAVLAILTVGQAASEEMIRSFERMGVNVALVGFELADPETGAPQIDFARLRSASGGADVAPVLIAPDTAQHGAAVADVLVVGTSAALRDSARLAMTAGRFLADRPDAGLVAGNGIAALLGISRPGERLRIGGRIFTVIGILDKTPPNPLFPFSFDQSLLVSLPSFGLLRGRAQSGAVVLGYPDVETLQRAAPQLVDRLSGTFPRYKFDLQLPVKLIDGMRAQARNQRLTLLAIGAIAMLVAGIGIMNTMFMSVTARLGEIGVRLSIGANAADVRNLFLLEGAILGVLGACAGVLVAVLSLHAYAAAAAKALPLTGTNIAIALAIPMISTTMFCLLPALRAARFQPIDMMREG